MIELDPHREALVRGMWEKGYIKLQEVVLRSGKSSLVYIDFREMISDPSLRNAATMSLADTIIKSKLIGSQPVPKMPYLASIPRGVDYYTGSLADYLMAPLLMRREKVKRHGIPKLIEGRFNAGDEVILIDDVITEGASKLEEVGYYKAENLAVKGIAVIVDRQRGGRTLLESKGITVESALKFSTMAKYALDESLANMTKGIYDEIIGEMDPQELIEL